MSTRLKHLILFFYGILALSYRSGYVIPHGGDTWGMAYEVSTIIDYGEITWYVTPLSLFGWFPFSYPSGELVLLSQITLVTGILIPEMVYLSSALFGIMGIYTVFLMSRQIFGDDIALLTSFFFLNMTWVIHATWNTISTRGLFVMLYPIALFLLLRIRSTRGKGVGIKYLLLAILTISINLSIHRIALIFMAVVLFPFLFSTLIHFFSDSRRLSFPSKKLNLAILFIAVAIFILQLSDFFFLSLSESQLSRHSLEFFSGENAISNLLNLAVDYGIYYGPASILAPFGLLGLILLPRRTFATTTLLLITLMAIVFIRDIKYFLYFFPPIASILVAYGFSWTFVNLRKISFPPSLVALLVFIVSIEFFFWYLEKQYYVLSILWILILIFMLRSVIFSKKGLKAAYISFVLFNLTFTAAETFGTSLDESDNFGRSEGVILSVSQRSHSAFWLTEYTTSYWFGYKSSYDLLVSTLTEAPLAYDYLLVYDNKLLLDQLSLNFEYNLTILWERHQTAWTYYVPYEYNPDYFGYNFIVRNNTRLAENQDVEFVVFNHEDIHNQESWLSIPYFVEYKYIIYNDDNYRIYYYT